MKRLFPSALLGLALVFATANIEARQSALDLTAPVGTAAVNVISEFACFFGFRPLCVRPVADPPSLTPPADEPAPCPPPPSTCDPATQSCP